MATKKASTASYASRTKKRIVTLIPYRIKVGKSYWYTRGMHKVKADATKQAAEIKKLNLRTRQRSYKTSRGTVYCVYANG